MYDSRSSSCLIIGGQVRTFFLNERSCLQAYLKIGETPFLSLELAFSMVVISFPKE